MASKKGQYQLGIEISGKTNRSLKGAVDSAQGDMERLRRKMYASGRIWNGHSQRSIPEALRR